MFRSSVLSWSGGVGEWNHSPTRDRASLTLMLGSCTLEILVPRMNWILIKLTPSRVNAPMTLV